MGLSASEQAERFESLEDSAGELNASMVAELPDVSEESELYVMDSIIEAPPLDQANHGYVVLPPREWTIGNSTEGEEIRMTFLEPAGRSMLIPHEGDLELPGELNATWIVRYERRNVLLTEGGSAVSIHVTPVAVRVEVPDDDPLYWLSPELFEAPAVSEP